MIAIVALVALVALAVAVLALSLARTAGDTDRQLERMQMSEEWLQRHHRDRGVG